mmetsp:Transcript_17497/g.39931  ORF Transcript_17497/g.39931 Transcript_17497/m.39931 type:complete len:563 (-) Transcript_17497:197-1885(-)|eukprot:CAMPEP_0201130500 /NCGR_PEP_ID=MMETSP0850-20130426/40026_1 /ASSEMBLY_ACC=CAM_ASM_000622 /TAXON_ID=183588 /ORGANISM="Pseudo-nitzschia fraudulenta, Strain WWA7" /LENGTH=562 /DNA_ID=CAMNT_0047400271 /DNA_START=22 /DNA_END=1710 /DNA_ORIENTATION=-
MSGSIETKMLLNDEEDGDDAISNEIKKIQSQEERHQQDMYKAKALSMTFMKSFSGICCDDCDNDPFKAIEHHNNSDKSVNGINQGSDNHESKSPIGLHRSSFFSKSGSSVSPLVIEPMMTKNLDYQNPGTIETLIGEYMCFCNFYKVHYNPGILTAIRFASPALRPSGAFHDSDMLALVELLLRHSNGALKHVTRLDFSISGKQGRHERNRKQVGFSSHGALSLAKVLQTTKFIREVYLPRNKIGPYGASALFVACRMNPTIEDLNLKRCRIGRQGAFAFCEIILAGTNQPLQSTDSSSGSGTLARGLVNVNMSINHLGHLGTAAIEKLLKERRSNKDAREIFVNLHGNLVFPEIMNAVTHCVGVFLSLLGGHLLTQEVRDSTYTHIISCGIFTGSLLSLYLSSTLFHSFFAMVNTRDVFRVLDKCAIYILIAGSYTPFMQILLSDQPMYSFGLLGFIWTCGVLGISVEAFYPNWKHKTSFSLSMYLGMGWSCVVCLPQMMARLHAPCVYLILLGGVAYTGGVPFFVRNNNLDHAIWHLFVMTGSILHWVAVYFYVASTPLH